MQAGQPVTPRPQPMLQPRVPSIWAQAGIYHPDPDKPHFETELEINDFPQHARWKVQTSHTRNTALRCFAKCEEVKIMFTRAQPSGLCWECLLALAPRSLHGMLQHLMQQ